MGVKTNRFFFGCCCLVVSIFSVKGLSLDKEVPPLICRLSSLQVLDLSDNLFTGLIPKCLGNFSQSLSVLKLRGNKFHGTIPDTFSNNSLRTLDFNGNQLEGKVPRSLSNCSSLEVLDLGNNRITDTYPFWLGSLPNLKVLVLRSNNFSGLLQCEKEHPFSTMHIIDISNNNFTGTLPSQCFLYWTAMKVDETKSEGKSDAKYMGESYYQDSMVLTIKGLEIEYVRILTIFIVVDLSNNKFQGQVPKTIGNLKSIFGLNLSHNSFTDHIPSALGNLKALESLDLSFNNFSGKIPTQLLDLSFLSVLNLSQNNLVGTIPRGKQFDTFTETSFQGNPGLCGPPLSKECNPKSPPVPSNPPPVPSNPLHSSESESTIEFDWFVILMGFGCGTVNGVLIGHFIFRRNYEWILRTTGINKLFGLYQ